MTDVVGQTELLLNACEQGHVIQKLTEIVVEPCTGLKFRP